MSDLATAFLGAIAGATVVMAIVQVGFVVYSARMTQRVVAVVDRVEKELAPAVGRVNEASGELRRAASVAAAQIDRADALFARVAERVDHVTAVAHEAVVEPTHRGVAVWKGVQAAVGVWRRSEEGRATSSEAS